MDVEKIKDYDTFQRLAEIEKQYYYENTLLPLASHGKIFVDASKKPRKTALLGEEFREEISKIYANLKERTGTRPRLADVWNLLIFNQACLEHDGPIKGKPSENLAKTIVWKYSNGTKRKFTFNRFTKQYTIVRSELEKEQRA